MKEPELEGINGIKTKHYFERYCELFDDIQFSAKHPEAYEAVNYFLGSKGKRVRPLLLILACDCFSDDVEKSYDPAFGIELFHNFTLIHDDIMDQAAIRRGNPSLHHKFSEGTAILTGDFLLILAYRYLARVDKSVLPKILSVFNTTATQIIEGQVLDASFEGRTNVSVSEYLKMIEYKTSVLLAASLKIGAVIGGADEENQEHIYNFGLKLGLAFQLKDDWLDVYGDKNLGKRIGGDIVRNKKTYLFIKALSLSNTTQRDRLVELSGAQNETYKIDETIGIYNDLGVGADLENYMNIVFREALESLEKISVDPKRKSELHYFAHRIYRREY